MADMSMKLENIIKSLRYCCGDLDVTRVCHKCPYHMPEDADRMCIDELMSEAADAIEELSGFVQEAERDRDEYRERLDKTNDLIMDELKRIRVKQQASEDGRTDPQGRVKNGLYPKGQTPRQRERCLAMTGGERNMNDVTFTMDQIRREAFVLLGEAQELTRESLALYTCGVTDLILRLSELAGEDVKDSCLDKSKGAGE